MFFQNRQRTSYYPVPMSKGSLLPTRDVCKFFRSTSTLQRCTLSSLCQGRSTSRSLIRRWWSELQARDRQWGSECKGWVFANFLRQAWSIYTRCSYPSHSWRRRKCEARSCSILVCGHLCNGICLRRLSWNSRVWSRWFQVRLLKSSSRICIHQVSPSTFGPILIPQLTNHFLAV